MNRNMKAITWGMEVRGLDPGPWRMLMVLCSFVGKRDFRVWPSYATMADKAEISRPSAKRYVQELVDRGLIEPLEPLWRENGGRSVNVYRICVGETPIIEADDDEEDDYLPASDPRVKLNRGGTHSYDSPPRVTGEPCREPLKEGTSNIENYPPLPSGEDTPTGEIDLFGGSEITTTDDRGTLPDYVRAGWNALHESYPRIHAIRVWSDSRKKALARRAAEVVREMDGAIDAYQVWDMIFDAIREDAWLRGDAPPGRGYDRSYVVEFDHVTRAKDFARIIEKGATNALDRAATTDARTGRQFGPTEQAGRSALTRFLASRAPSGRG